MSKFGKSKLRVLPIEGEQLQCLCALLKERQQVYLWMMGEVGLLGVWGSNA